MRRSTKDQLHEIGQIYEDLMLLGGSVWKSTCSCGWTSRPAKGPGIALGLFRRHIVLAGRS